MLNTNQVINFIQNAYNNLNGKVNKDINTNLIFDKAFIKGGVYGFTLPFNTIYINLYNIENFFNKSIWYDNDYKTLLLEIIVHELSHVDQNIDYRIVKSKGSFTSDDYIKRIEEANIVNTIKFILNNEAMINSSLGFTINRDLISSKLNNCNLSIPYETKNTLNDFIVNFNEFILKNTNYNTLDISDITISDDMYCYILKQNNLYYLSSKINKVLDKVIQKLAVIKNIEYKNDKMLIQISVRE